MGSVRYELVGDIAGNERRFDGCVEFFKSESGMRKARTTLERSAFNFQLFVALGNPDPRVGQGHDYVQNNIDGPLCREDAINMIYNNNTTTHPFLPLTAWILIHRLGHAIQVYERKVVIPALQPFVDMLTYLSGVQIEPTQSVMEYDYHPLLATLRMLMTMRSARTNSFSSSTEQFPELLAQFVINGKITLLRPQHWAERRETIIKRYNEKASDGDYALYQNVKTSRNYSMFNTVKAMDLVTNGIMSRNTMAEVDEALTHLEELVNATFAELMNNMVGKVVAF